MVLAAALFVGCVEPTTALDGGAVDGSLPDGGGDAGSALDGGLVLDGTLMVPDAGSDGATDASTLDGGIDSGLSFCTCDLVSECAVPGCIGTDCVPTWVPDGTPCTGGRCFAGACVVGGLCGDGFREPGPDPAREGCDDGDTDSAGDACAADCTPQVLVVASVAGEQALPGLVSVAEDDVGDLLFVWSETRGEQLFLQARGFTAAGAPVFPSVALSDDLGLGWDAHVSVVGLASGWAVVWSERGGDASEAGIRVRIVGASGMAASSRRVNQYELGRQAAPVAARVGTGFLVAWADESGTVTLPGESRLRQRSFDAGARGLTDESALSVVGTSARDVSLASDGTTVLAVWAEDPSVPFARTMLVGRRLGGTSPDAVPFTISDEDGAQPAAAFLDDGDIAVTWVGRSVDPQGDIRTRLVHATGDPLAGTMITTLTPLTVPPSPTVAEVAPRVLPLMGGDYLVAYEDGGTRRGVTAIVVGSSTLAPEYPTLAPLLASGLQGDVTLLRTARGYWFAWSDTTSAGEPTARRSFLAYLLPPS